MNKIYAKLCFICTIIRINGFSIELLNRINRIMRTNTNKTVIVQSGTFRFAPVHIQRVSCACTTAPHRVHHYDHHYKPTYLRRARARSLLLAHIPGNARGKRAHLRVQRSRPSAITGVLRVLLVCVCVRSSLQSITAWHSTQNERVCIVYTDTYITYTPLYFTQCAHRRH